MLFCDNTLSHSPAMIFIYCKNIAGGKFMKTMNNNLSDVNMQANNAEILRNEIAQWHSWACTTAKFPYGSGKNAKLSQADNARHIDVLILRLLAIMVMEYRCFIPECIFTPSYLSRKITFFCPDSIKSGNYYNAILQNLFFAAIGRKAEERSFTDGKNCSRQYGINSFFRDDKRKTFFKTSYKEIIELFRNVPQICCRLFECEDSFEDNAASIKRYSDGFSREAGRRAFVPDALFFQKRKEGHEGIITILKRHFHGKGIQEISQIMLDLIPAETTENHRNREDFIALMSTLLRENNAHPEIIAVKSRYVKIEKPNTGRGILQFNNAARHRAAIETLYDKIRSAKNRRQARQLRIRCSQIEYSLAQNGFGLVKSKY